MARQSARNHNVRGTRGDFDLEMNQAEMEEFAETIITPNMHGLRNMNDGNGMPPPPPAQPSQPVVHSTPGTDGHGAGGQTDGADDVDVAEIDGTQFADNAGKQKGGSHRGKQFLPEEDVVIVSGWLNVTTDATIGANQNKDAFYARLHRYYMDNLQTGEPRTMLPIQGRWTAIRKAVSKFQGNLSAIQRRNESGKTDQDKINDAIRMYQSSKPWQFGHCWEILRNEPKWNDYLLELNKPKHAAKTTQPPTQPATQPEAPSDTRTETQRRSLDRPEGRDSAKRRRGKGPMEDSASSVAVEMLQKIHERGNQMDEQDAKHKDEILSIERGKFQLQEKALLAKIEHNDKALELQREISHEEIKLKREIMATKREMVETNRFQTEVQIMFTDLEKCNPAMRHWLVAKQKDILMRSGIDPSLVDNPSGPDCPSGPATSSGPSGN